MPRSGSCPRPAARRARSRASLTGGAGYFWFGKQSAELGGFPLPAYLNWHAGVTFTRNMLNLDLRYYDTNLSKEDCFVFTGDPGATPGGSIDPVRNPEGLRSRWCSATFVAKVWFALKLGRGLINAAIAYRTSNGVCPQLSARRQEP